MHRKLYILILSLLLLFGLRAAVSAEEADASPFGAVKFSAGPFTFTGDPIEPDVTVCAPDGTIVPREKYSVSYSNNVNAGTAEITVTGLDEYEGRSAGTAFTILPAPITSAKLKYDALTYTGKALKPDVTVKGNFMGRRITLTRNTDYTVTYRNNTVPGTAAVTIKGKGRYSGTIRKTFRIKPVPIGDLSSGDLVDPEMIDGIENKYFRSYSIRYGDDVFHTINGKSYRKNPDIALSDLRYLKVLHYNFDHKIQVGEIIVNKSIAGDTLSIFKELFHAQYEIFSMHLIDKFWTGDPSTTDDRSCRRNNTSAFCYRTVTRGTSVSRHGYGMAIDINPVQNPCVWFENGVMTADDKESRPFIDRTWNDPHMITTGDACWSAFVSRGFSWGGDWLEPIDYQHFEK